MNGNGGGLSCDVGGARSSSGGGLMKLLWLSFEKENIDLKERKGEKVMMTNEEGNRGIDLYRRSGEERIE